MKNTIVKTSIKPFRLVDRNVNDTFKFNQETEMVPVLGLVSAQLNEASASKVEDEQLSAASLQKDHHPALLALLAEELSVKAEEIHDFELYVDQTFPYIWSSDYLFRHLYDTQPSVLGGINNEFMFSPRMDNLVSS